MLKLGIMGGTFNPVHEGHLMIARVAMKAAQLDEVIFLPSGQPPHKQSVSLASPISRLNMTILAVQGQKEFSVSDMEVLRLGTTYTVDTLEQMKQVHSLAQLYYIIGGDTLFQMETWRSAEKVFSMLEGVVVIPRPGIDCTVLDSKAQSLSVKLGLKNYVIAEECGPDISSTDVRRKIEAGESTAGLLPASVSDYIAAHGLYGAAYSQTVMHLKHTLSEYRFRHTLSVAETAVWLAYRVGVDPFQAHLAGLLHDCARNMDAPTLLRLIKSGGISADELELSMPALLHAPAGAALARTQYHVSDPAVLSAIRWHTTGRRNMTALEKVVYLADMIEPERTAYPGLEELRKSALGDLDEAVHMAAAQNAAYVAERGKKLHPRTTELAKERFQSKTEHGGKEE